MGQMISPWPSSTHVGSLPKVKDLMMMPYVSGPYSCRMSSDPPMAQGWLSLAARARFLAPQVSFNADCRPRQEAYMHTIYTSVGVFDHVFCLCLRTLSLNLSNLSCPDPRFKF